MSLQMASELNRQNNSILYQKWQKRKSDPNNRFKYTLSDLRHMQSSRRRPQPMQKQRMKKNNQNQMVINNIQNNSFDDKLPTLPVLSNNMTCSAACSSKSNNNGPCSFKSNKISSELPIMGMTPFENLSTNLRNSIQKDLTYINAPKLSSNNFNGSNLPKLEIVSSLEKKYIYGDHNNNDNKNDNENDEEVSNITSSKTDVMKNGLISVIIVTHDSRKYIYHSLFTILKQTYRNYEVIIIDNNSKDGTVEYITEMSDARLKVYALENETSLVNCYNLGMYYSKGEYITFLDATFTNTSERLFNQLNSLQEECDVSVVADQITEDDKYLYNFSSLMISRNLFNNFGYFKYNNDEYKHDKNNMDFFVEYCYRMTLHGVKVKTIDDLLYINYGALLNGDQFKYNKQLKDVNIKNMDAYVEFEGKEEFKL